MSKKIRIGVISDTHIPDRADKLPKKIIEEFKNVDMVIHAGDLVDLKVIQELKAICKDVRAVYGNMDPYEVRRELAEKEIIQVGKHKIGLIHGLGHPANLPETVKKNFKDAEVDIIIFGHSHSPLNEIRDNILFFNPGSATDKIFSPYNSFGIIELNDKIEAKIIKLS